MCFVLTLHVLMLQRTCWVRYHLLISTGKDRCQKCDELLCCDSVILEYPFHTSVEKGSCQPPSCLSSFKILKEHFSLSVSICCKGILKCFFTLLISCLHLTCPVLWPFLFSFSFSSLSEISWCSFLHSPDTFWAARLLIYLKRSGGESFIFNHSVF